MKSKSLGRLCYEALCKITQLPYDITQICHKTFHLLAMNYHGTSFIRLDPVANYSSNSPSKLKQCICKRTVMAVPFGEMELQNKSLFYYRLQ